MGNGVKLLVIQGFSWKEKLLFTLLIISKRQASVSGPVSSAGAQGGQWLEERLESSSWRSPESRQGNCRYRSLDGLLRRTDLCVCSCVCRVPLCAFMHMKVYSHVVVYVHACRGGRYSMQSDLRSRKFLLFVRGDSCGSVGRVVADYK